MFGGRMYIGKSGGAGATNFSDAVFYIWDQVDPTIQIWFDAAGATATKTTIATSQSVDQVTTIPDQAGVADVFLVQTLAQNVFNKTLDNTNTVELLDSNFTLDDNVDPTKKARFQLSSISTATLRTFTLPDTSDVVVTEAFAQTLTNKTMSLLAPGGNLFTGFTAGSIVFHDGSTFMEDNAKFFWDNTNFRLGIGTNAPLYSIDLVGSIRVRYAPGDGYVLQDSSLNDYTVLYYDGADILNLVSGGIGLYLGDNGNPGTLSIVNDLIGINNAAPAYELDIVGTTKFDGVTRYYDGGSGFTTVVKASPALTANNAFTFPPTNGVASEVLTTDGAGNTSWSNVPIPAVPAPPSAVEAIAASGTITIDPTRQRNTTFIAGNAAAVTVDPVTGITDGTFDGQECVIVGMDDTNTVTLDSVGNVEINGSVTLGYHDSITLLWDNTNSVWFELARS
jgi:hypothetical protein